MKHILLALVVVILVMFLKDQIRTRKARHYAYPDLGIEFDLRGPTWWEDSSSSDEAFLIYLQDTDEKVRVWEARLSIHKKPLIDNDFQKFMKGIENENEERLISAEWDFRTERKKLPAGEAGVEPEKITVWRREKGKDVWELASENVYFFRGKNIYEFTFINMYQPHSFIDENIQLVAETIKFTGEHDL